MNRHRSRALVAIGFATLGFGALGFGYWWSSAVPRSPTDLQILFAFGIASLVLASRAVEVNDRLLISSSTMVVLAAGLVLATRSVLSGQPVTAAFYMTLVSTVGFLSPGDLRNRQLARASINFGQLAVSGLSAGLALEVTFRVVDGLLDASTGSQLAAVDLELVLAAAAASLAGAVSYTLVNFLAVRFAAHRIYGRTGLVPWSHVTGIFLLQVAQCFIGGVLGFVLGISPSAALIPVVLAVFVIGNMAFSAQATLRSTHEAMLKGFIKILETRDLYTRGHTERVAEFALAIGRELGFSDTQLARLRWAALIHDVGKLAVPTAIMRKQGTLTEEEFHEMRVATHRVDDLLSEVDFLAPMVRICSGVHPRLDLDEDFGQTGHTHSLRATREQSVLAVADAFDAMTSTRSYRMAMNQRTALERLTATEDPLFHPEVLAALGSALSKMPGSYGPPDLAGTEVLRA